MKFLGVLLMAVAASADLYSNGQYFGSGIVIVDAPAPNSTFQVNATMPIAIDISLDVITNLFPPFCNQVDAVSIFLTATNFNLTVRNPLNLSSEPGSTVLHPNWIVPGCVPAGDYNLTFNELDTINGTHLYSSINIPVSINAPAGWKQQPNCSNNSVNQPLESNTTTSAASMTGHSYLVAAIVLATLCYFI
ncbi:hypothetical protein INT43_001580 [Umbelopsis isabellina]|uniref:Uncharacterized protein n=1 Tax=Mortierella isabellina TaxID=91625 RepID=A0A8H7U9U5_MORIS|nr:hypothetical protein INT43_001580 [Umbelopsis isabellina]